MKQPQPPPSTTILHHLLTLDQTLSLSLYTLTQPILPRFFLKLLELSGDGKLFFPLLLSLLLSPLPATSPLLFTLFINLLIGSLLDLILIGSIKHLVRRPRPLYNKHMFLTFAVDHWSFPSGHASRVCFIASVIYCCSADLVEYVLGLGEYESIKWLNIGVIGWACATSVSRVLLGRHYVFDVAAGAALGVLNAAIVLNYLNCTVTLCRVISKGFARGLFCLCFYEHSVRDGTTEDALDHIDDICRQKITWAERGSEEQKFGVTQLSRNLNWRYEEDILVVPSWGPLHCHIYIL